MSVLLYARDAEGHGRRLINMLSGMMPPVKTTVCRTIRDLVRELRSPSGLHLDRLAVIMASTRHEMAEILSIRELLTDVRFILILPDHEKDTLARAHSLGPRFVTYMDGDYSDVEAVVKKMAATTTTWTSAQTVAEGNLDMID